MMFFNSSVSALSLFILLVSIFKPCTAEIVTREVFFRGDSELSQLHKMFSVLGTPTEQQWLGVTSLINWNSFPDWHPKDQGSAFPSLSPQGVDLLTKLLKLNPAERISAKAALDHSYFDSLDKSTF